MRNWGRVALGGIVVLTSSLAITVPAGAAPSHPGGVPDTCPEVLAGAPTGGIEKVTDPADGSVVHRGDVISVTLRWDTTTFTDPVLHKALDCVTIDGTPADDLSTQERDTPNDGRFDYRFTVPGDLPDGARLCDRGFVSGPDGDGFNRQKSNDVCFVVRVDQPAEAPAPIALPVAAPVSPGPSPVPSAGPFAAPVSGTAPSPAPITAGPAGQGRPGTEVSPDTAEGDQPQATLPRTGSAVEDTVLLGGLALIFGGLCLVAGRRPVRAAGPA